MHEQNLVARKRVLGPDEPDTLHSRLGLAKAYQGAGRTAEAITLYEQNLADCERTKGPDDPEALHYRKTLATVYRAAEAEDPKSQPSDP